MEQTEVFSVGDLTQYIQELLELDPTLHQVWVVGEVTSAKRHPSGVFFTLSDEETGASIRCVSWKGQQSKLVQQPIAGEKLLVLGSIRLYPKRGEYQLNVYQALPAGEGLQALQLRQLQARLEAEGLFDEAKKKPTPTLPQTIAVVTSSTAAAWGDIQRTLTQRYPNLTVLLSPAIVQGQNAPRSIVQAIARVEQDGRAEVIILARGGGATEDLSAFNREEVVRAIANCSIPIVTGIGHQRDETLSDWAADAFAHTPTAAAQMVVPHWQQMLQQHQQRKLLLIDRIQQRLEAESERMVGFGDRLERIPQSSQIVRATAQCQRLKERLTALDPHQVLNRGYAVAQLADGTLLRDSEIALGEELIIRLGKGKIKVAVIEIIE